MPRGKTYRTRALVLDKTKLGEQDLILTLLAEDGRQVRCVAKGARKPGSRLAARCELACSVDLLIAYGRSLDVVSQAELLEATLGADVAYETLMAASAVLEVARLSSFEDAQDRFIYPITLRALEVVGGAAGALDGAHLDLIVAAYTFKLLAHEGYRADLFHCVACGDEALSYFSAQAGGLLCASCAGGVPGAEELDGRLVGWLRALMGLRFDELAARPIDSATSAMLVALAHAWAATHLDARLRTFEFLLGC